MMDVGAPTQIASSLIRAVFQLQRQNPAATAEEEVTVIKIKHLDRLVGGFIQLVTTTDKGRSHRRTLQLYDLNRSSLGLC